jgi:BMFP domain-containing protein YqiC
MAKTPTPLTELFATLKGYINQLSSGERSASEVGSALNDWARDSAESIKAKIHEEVEASVSKMGFIKREEFDALLLRISKLEAELAPPKGKKNVKKSVKKVSSTSKKKKD